MRDPEFGSKLRQIQEYWRSASLAISSGPGEGGRIRSRALMNDVSPGS